MYKSFFIQLEWHLKTKQIIVKSIIIVNFNNIGTYENLCVKWTRCVSSLQVIGNHLYIHHSLDRVPHVMWAYIARLDVKYFIYILNMLKV